MITARVDSTSEDLTKYLDILNTYNFSLQVYKRDKENKEDIPYVGQIIFKDEYEMLRFIKQVHPIEFKYFTNKARITILD
ncbi:MAG: hypothetical protein ACOC2W_04860 [bacterium]